VPLYVFDTSPLSAFARLGRLDVLEARVGDSARWPVEVQDEIRRGVAAGHAHLTDVLGAAWLGEPVRLTDPGDLAEIERLRQALGGTEARPERHRGEAATMVVAQQLDAVAVLDERDARRLATVRSIPIIGTEGVLRACARHGQLTWDEAWDLFSGMRGLGERLRQITRDEFEDA
jgi:predicted nucleic acid-binding protein